MALAFWCYGATRHRVPEVGSSMGRATTRNLRPTSRSIALSTAHGIRGASTRRQVRQLLGGPAAAGPDDIGHKLRRDVGLKDDDLDLRRSTATRDRNETITMTMKMTMTDALTGLPSAVSHTLPGWRHLHARYVSHRLQPTQRYRRAK
jgi:hypothetical protein